MKARAIQKRKTIINDTSSFYNYDSKDRTFDIWEKEKIPCPNFLPISPIDADNDIDSTIARIKQFIDEHGKVFLRTNNETVQMVCLFWIEILRRNHRKTSNSD